MPNFLKWNWPAISDNQDDFFNWLAKYLSKQQSEDILYFAQLYKFPIKHVTFYDPPSQFYPKSITHLLSNNNI